MTPEPARRSKIWPFLYLSAVLLLSVYVLRVQAHQFPYFERDAGVFLYAGQRWLAGEWPYLAVWDHKGPLIYALNAAGLWLAGGAAGGVRLVELVSLAAAAGLSFGLLRRRFALETALMVTAWWLLTLLHLLNGGNTIEQFALPLQFGALFLFLTEQQGDPRPRAAPLLIGVLGALSFLLRANMIGVFVAIGLAWLIIERRWRPAALAAAGGVVVLVSVAILFWQNQALGPLLDQSLLFNFLYVQSTATEKINSLVDGLQLVNRTGLAVAGGLGVAAAFGPRGEDKFPTKSLLFVLIGGLLFEMALAVLSGRSFPHYYIAWLPLLAWSAAFLVDLIGQRLQSLSIGRRLAVSWLVIGVLALPQTRELIAPLFSNQAPKVVTVQQTLDYLADEVPAGAPLLVWGAEVQLNALSGRPAPTRYAYLYPLIVTNYADSGMTAELDAALRAPDLVIIDTAVNGGTVLPIAAEDDRPLDLAAFGPSELDQGQLNEARQYVRENFVPVAQIGPEGWVVYRHQSE